MEQKKIFRILNDNPNLKENIVDITVVEFMNYVKDNRSNVLIFSQMIMSIISCFPEVELNLIQRGRCSLVQNKTLLSISIKENDSRTISITISEFNYALNFRKESQNLSANIENFLYKIYDMLILEHEALNFLENATKVFNRSISGKFTDNDLFIN